jgi:GDP-L-fucose synthase
MKVLVTGSNGLVGSAIREECKASSIHEFHFVTRGSADLTDRSQVENLFDGINPDAVIHTAAKVGGIEANRTMQEDFFYDNILINTNVIRACVKFKVDKLLAFSSVCVFPDDLALLEEDKIHSGPVYASNFAYGYAKRMVDVHIRAAKEQHGVKNWTSVIPGNIFGKNDMYDINNGHIIPALIHKIYLAKNGGEKFSVWGDGNSLREFMYVNDLAKLLIQILDKDNLPDKILMSGRKETSIKDVVELLMHVSGYNDSVDWDRTKPNGQRSRPSSNNRIDTLFPNFVYTDLKCGLQESWDWFVANYPNVRTSY